MTYSSKWLYSTMKIMKSKYRLSLTDDYLTELLRPALTSIQPNLKKLTEKIDTPTNLAQHLYFIHYLY